MQLRVRSLDGAELVLDVPQYTVRLQVAEIKRLSLTQLLQLRVDEEGTEMPALDEETKDSEPIDVTQDAPSIEALQDKMASSCLVFSGHILADADDVNLFAVAPSDFFVLVEDMDEDNGDVVGDDGENDADTKNEEDQGTPHKRRRKVDQGKTSEQRDACVVQLMEMGFDIDQAGNALELTGGELSRAIALLMGEAIASSETTANPSNGSRLREFVAKLIQQYPELAAIESLLMVEQVHRLKKVAMRSDFDAFVMLKESFPAHWLAQMNENPAAMALFLSLPQHLDNQQQAAAKKQQKTMQNTPNREIDLTIEAEDDVEIVVSTIAKDQDAIERLASMGFAPDLVAAVYESCGGNEEIAANLLFETLS